MTTIFSGAAKLPSLPEVRVQDRSLQQFLDAVREVLEVRSGARNRFEQGVTMRDLVNLGLLNESTLSGASGRMLSGGGARPSSQDSGGVIVNTGTKFTAVPWDEIARRIADSKLFRNMMASLSSDTRFDDLPEQIRAILLKDIAKEAADRGADVRRIEQKIQTNELSQATAIQEVTASLGSSLAGVRETAFASATTAMAAAGKVTQIRAALGDPDTFTGAGVTLEEAMFGTATHQGLFGQYTVKIDAGGKIAGIGLAVDAPVGAPVESAVIIQADKFAVVAAADTIADPLNPPAERIPFGIDTVNNTIYINGNVRINAGGTRLQDVGLGTSYWVETSVAALRLNAAGTTFTPTSITVSGKQQTGGSTTPYSGWFKIDTSPDGSTWTNRYSTSGAAESSTNWTVAPTSERYIRCQIYSNSGFTTLVDEETIPVVQDGSIGVDGKPAITVVMTNEVTALPADSDGAITSFVNSGFTVRIYEGSTLLTYDSATLAPSKFVPGPPTISPAGSISIGAHSGTGTTTWTVGDHAATGSTTAVTDTIQITYPVTVRRADGTDVVVTITQAVTKSRAGAEAISRWVDTSVAAVKLNTAGTTFTPTSLTVSGKQQSGATISAYSGRFIIATSPDGATFTDRYTSAADESSSNWTITPTSTRFIRVRLYQAGGTATLLDEETIPVVQDGALGADGRGAITVVMSNDNVTLPATDAGAITSFSGSGFVVQVYEGGTQLIYNTTLGLGNGRFVPGTPTISPAGAISVGGSSGAGGGNWTVADHSATGTTTSVTTPIQITWNMTVRRLDGTDTTVVVVQNITKAKQGAQGATGSTGATGATGATGPAGSNGTRGSLSLYISGSGPLTSSECDSAILSATGSSTRVLGDTVTEGNGLTYVSTLRWNGSSWMPPGVIIDGSLLVTGSVSAAALAANSIDGKTITGSTIRTAASGARIEINHTGNYIAGFNSAGVAKFVFDADTGLFELMGSAPILYLARIENDSTGEALRAANTSSGTALRAINSGTGLSLHTGPRVRMDLSTETGAATATFSGTKPGASQTNVWVPITLSDGNEYMFPCWKRNA